MILIQGRTAPAVWLSAVEHVMMRPRAEDFDVFLHITHPTVLSTEDRIVHDEVDTFLKSHGAFGLHTVAETIFPLSAYLRGGTTEVFEHFPETLRQIQKGRADGNWGTYAYRILRQMDHKGNLFNPLKDLIEKITKHGKYKASFELSDGIPFEDELKIYAPATDRKRLYGGPCLSHLSIKVHDGFLRFNATYRSHYYIRRLLGNLIGLGRLQYFIARETELEVGGLTINSTLARIDTRLGGSNTACWTKDEIRDLISRCRSTYNTVQDAA